MTMSSFVHDFLPTFAVAAGLLAVIWLACAVITTAGIYVGGFVFLGARALVRMCIRPIRRRWTSEYAQLVTVDADGVTAKPVNPRRARRWREQPTPNATPPKDTERGAP